MQNNTAFAEDVRDGVGKLLIALSSVDSTRKAYLEAADRALGRAQINADTPEETLVAQKLVDALLDMMKRPTG